jgi:hypothetical protein
MIFVGDVHGAISGNDPTNPRSGLEYLNAILPRGEAIIQVGDFGWADIGFGFDFITAWTIFGASLNRKLYFGDGNHESFPLLPMDANEPVEMAPNIFYVPRGTVLTLEGLRIGFLGGAASIDQKFRTKDINWFEEENIRPQDIAKTYEWKDIDIMVTHTPPQHVVRFHNSGRNLDFIQKWQLPLDWKDHNAEIVEDVWMRMGKPPLVCGHLHRSLLMEKVRVLAIDEAASHEAVLTQGLP